MTDRQLVKGFTIDDVRTKDIDDAIWVERLEELNPFFPHGGPEKRAYWKVWVSITDTSSVVLGSAEDLQARKATETRYYASGSSPMLTKRLAELDLSLWPHRTHRTLTAEIELDAQLEVTRTDLYLSEMMSAAKLAYSEVPTILGQTKNTLQHTLATAAALADRLLTKRRQAGALALYDLATGHVTTEEGRLKKLRSPEDSIGYIIIQELMILANTQIAKWALAKELPILFRNHNAKPSTPERTTLADQINQALSGSPQKQEAFEVRADLILGRAVYGATVEGHYGLNLPVYTHFTSPIRRYADLLTHRQLVAILSGEEPPYTQTAMAVEAEHINQTHTAYQETKALHMKGDAERRAHSAVAENRLKDLGDREFERVAKVETRSDADPSDPFRAEFLRRLEQETLPLICATLVFTAAPMRSAPWDDLRAAVVRAFAGNPGAAYSLLTQATTVGTWKVPTFNLREEGPDHARRFIATCLVGTHEGIVASAPFESSSIKDARYRAALGALAILAHIDTPAFASAKPAAVERCSGLDPNKNPIAAINEYAQALNVEAPEYLFEASGPPHAPTFVATVKFRSLTVRGEGSNKQAAKLKAAEELARSIRG